MNQLNGILEDDDVKGVVLKVNTPGGGVVESADIYDAIRTIQQEREIPFMFRWVAWRHRVAIMFLLRQIRFSSIVKLLRIHWCHYGECQLRQSLRKSMASISIRLKQVLTKTL